MSDKRSVSTLPAVILLLFFIIMVFSGSANAVVTGGFRLGPLRVMPSLGLNLAYDSNIELAPDHATSDVTSDLGFGITAVLPMQKYYVQLKGNLHHQIYSKTSGENNTTGGAGIALGADFPGGLSLDLGMDYAHQFQQTTTELGPHEYHDSLSLNAEADYRVNDSLSLAVQYFHYGFDWATSTDRDRQENTGAIRLYYRFLPKTSAVIEGSGSLVDYTENTANNNTVGQIRLGLTWDVTGKSTGELLGGWQFKRYDHTSSQDTNLFVIGGRVKTEFSRYTSLSADIIRTAMESDYTLNPYYVETLVTATLTQKLTYKISANVAIDYGRWSYPNATTELGQTAERRDTVWGAKLGVTFQMFRWLGLNAGLGWENRQSNLDAFDYNDFKANLGGQVAF